MYPDPNSIVDYLKSQGQPSDFATRATMARRLGITDYTGTAEQNTQLLNMMRSGGSVGLGAIGFWTWVKSLFGK